MLPVVRAVTIDAKGRIEIDDVPTPTRADECLSVI
jgi:hypothetical protein